MADRATETKLRILTALAEHPDLEQCVWDLGKALGLPPARLYNTFYQLEKDGLITSRRAAAAGRRTMGRFTKAFYSITPSGVDRAAGELLFSHPAFRGARLWPKG